MVFINELTIEYDPYLARKKKLVQLGEEVYEKNLKASLKLERINVGIFAYIIRGSQTSLILVRKMSKKELTSAHDKLDLNAFQFVKEIHKPHIISFICDLYTNLITSTLQ